MRICYLNHDTRNNTGAGRFYNFFTRAVKKAIPGIDIEVLTSENILYPNKLKLFFALPVIRKILKRCDIIHALDGWPYGVIAALATLGLKRKLIITAIGTGAVQPLYSWWRRAILKWAYRKADRVIAVSHNTQKEILKIVPDLKIEVINHGVDFTKFTSMAGTSDDRWSSDVKKLKPYILSVGAWKARKGFEYSIKAFEEIKDKFPNLKYVIVSKVPEEIKAKYERITFLENINEEKLIALYKNAELFILLPQDINKDIEGFGLAFLEAAAAGLPVIATKESSAEDAVLDGQSGILVPPRDWKAAAEAMRKILGNSNLRKSFSENSLKFAQSMSWDIVAKKYKVLYEDLF